MVMATAVAVMPGMLKQARADGSTAIVVNTLRLARDRAIGERRNMDVVFIPPNRIQGHAPGNLRVIPPPIPAPAIVRTTIMEAVLESDQKFMYFTGTGDTDDGFGLTNTPLAFASDVTLPTVMFTSEGTLINTSGDPVNGTVFLGTGAEWTSARAVTHLRADGDGRSWKWDGRRWVE